jgi:hypothetical protein
MTHTVYLKDPLSGVSEEDTSVVYPPELSGSKKIKLRGVPEDCETGDFTIRARVKATDVRRLIGKLRGPYEEGWSGHAGGSQRELARSNRLAFEISAETMRDGFYELQFVARRKGAPQLKREVKFQLC